MTRMLAGGLVLIVGTEVFVLALGASRWLLPAAGAAAALVLLTARLSLAGPRHRPAAGPAVDDGAESLRRWKSRTEATISRAESTRADWDRHLRPRLAREFIQATRHTDHTALAATGRIVFGDDLWPWVDPSNISRSGGSEPAPGYPTLAEILRRMEQL